MKLPFALLLMLAASCVVRAQDDPLKSPACGAALAQLQGARTDGTSAANVENLRSNAASACLGTSTPASRPSRVLQAPVAIPPPQIDVPQHVAPFPSPSVPPPPVAIQRPPMPALCDAGGCWSNEGSHLRYVPPGLVGPPGYCTSHGGQVLCP